jgi:antitoxin (DNA-binding transcriptional repressor) of toxin-antitoxin stability system
MKTITITAAKRHLGAWLKAAAHGENIGIVSGADIIALRKVDVESTDYAQTEYHALPSQVQALDEATDRRYRSMKKKGKLTTLSPRQLKKSLE